MFGRIPQFKNITYLPFFVLKETWHLVQIDFKQKNLTLFNSYGITNSDTNYYLLHFITLLKKYNCNKSLYATFKKFNEVGWKVKQCEHPKTLQSCESGLLILFILDLLTRKDHLNHVFDTETFSKKLQYLMLEFSSNVKEFCPLCGKFEEPDNIMNWIECDLCHRWIHIQCDKRNLNLKESLESPNVIYYCPICSLNFNKMPYSEVTNSLPITDFYPNGLSTDTEYYRNSNLFGNYTVACFKCSLNLTIEDYNTLNPGQYLSNVLFHIYTELLSHYNMAPTIKIWSIFKTSLLLFDISTLEKSFFLDPFFVDIFDKINLIPILKNSHFTLIVANLKNNTFTYIDPFGTNIEQGRDMLKRFNIFLNKLNQMTNISFDTSLEIIRTEHIRQRDGYNCGIYVIHFIECVFKNKHFSENFSPDEKRYEMKKFLLQKSEDMRHRCLKCGKLLKSFHGSVQCNVCKRYIEQKCVFIVDVCPLCDGRLHNNF